MSKAEPPVMTVKEAAEFLRVSSQTIYALVTGGKLESRKLGDGPKAPVRILRQSVYDYLGYAGPTEKPNG